MSAKKAVRILIKGNVQGIGYRFFVQDIGRQMGVDGWVRNLYNGDVEIEACSEADTLEQFEKAIRTQHPFARVEDMDVTAISAEECNCSGFNIIH